MTSCFHLCFRREKGEVQGNAESDYDSEEENEDGDLTVYECPGLAPVSSMQEKFQEKGRKRVKRDGDWEGRL